MPQDVLYELALNLNVDVLLKSCSTSLQFAALCDDPHFWDLYCQEHFMTEPGKGSKDLAHLMAELIYERSAGSFFTGRLVYLLSNGIVSPLTFKIYRYNSLIDVIFGNMAESLDKLAIVNELWDWSIPEPINQTPFTAQRIFRNDNVNEVFNGQEKVLFNILVNANVNKEYNKILTYIYQPTEYYCKYGRFTLELDMDKLDMLSMCNKTDNINNIFHLYNSRVNPQQISYILKLIKLQCIFLVTSAITKLRSSQE